MIQCVICEKTLVGDLDTFGPPNIPMCWGCYAVDAHEENRECVWRHALEELPPPQNKGDEDEFNSRMREGIAGRLLPGWR